MLVPDYLARIGLPASAAASLAPDHATLVRLMTAHLSTVPFENLDIHLGHPITLDVDRIADKIVRRHRGGFCYELNGAFAALLGSLGYRVSLLEARVPGPGGELGIRFDHLCLEVALDQPWLVDVGFGQAFAEPLRLDRDGVDQDDPAGAFRITPVSDGWFELTRDGDPEYSFSRRPRHFEDFAEGCVHNQTSPESHFTRGTICSLMLQLPVGRGRVSLAGSLLIETDAAGVRRETKLDASDIGPVLAEQFGIELSEDELEALAP